MKTEHFRKKLQAEKATLEEELGKIGRRNPSVPDDWEPMPLEVGGESDLADQAEVMTNRENTAAILTALETRYDTVLDALARIEKKTYGTCSVCKEPILEARLEADPAARTCVAHFS